MTHPEFEPAAKQYTGVPAQHRRRERRPMRTLDPNHAIELASAGSLPPLATGGFHECTQLRTLHCGDL